MQLSFYTRAAGLWLAWGVPLRADLRQASTPPPVQLPSVEVNARQERQLDSIDRKIYNLKGDVTGLTGSAADVLRNIPSVDVDLDGNVSLRGSGNVQILIDGRTSALMSKATQADVLSQYPADAIDHIEVITNPSAQYKPDGGAGIINLVLKKSHRPGFSGSLRLTYGSSKRYGVGVSGNYNPGKFNLATGFTLRRDDRPRTASDRRSHVDPVSGLAVSTTTFTYEHARPLFLIGLAQLEYQPQKSDKWGEAVNVTSRSLTRLAHEVDQTQVGATPTTFERGRYDPEVERDLESKTTYYHRFGRDDHTLGVEFRWKQHTEDENDHYRNSYPGSGSPATDDHLHLLMNAPATEAQVDYSNVIDRATKVEAGFDRVDDREAFDHTGESTDPVSGVWAPNPNFNNRFLLSQSVTALAGTYEKTRGGFGAIAGLRMEKADIDARQVTLGTAATQRSFHLYPSLHLSENLSPTDQLQLSYSQRVNRPDGEDFNPYPEYQDPYNVRAGNPHLRPEEVHSLEGGYQYKKDDTSYLATLFLRSSLNTFTTVTRYLDATTLLTTQENIGRSNSGGLELAATASPWKPLSLNASGDIYYNQIDASNLGYAGKRSTVAWTGKLNAEYAWSKTTSLQFMMNYRAKRLTPQGYRLPSLVANAGVRHEIRKNLTLVLAGSNLFNSDKEETRIDTPALHDDSTRRRNARYGYVGLIYAFGSGKKKGKAEALQFEN